MHLQSVVYNGTPTGRLPPLSRTPGPPAGVWVEEIKASVPGQPDECPSPPLSVLLPEEYELAGLEPPQVHASISAYLPACLCRCFRLFCITLHSLCC